MERLKALNSHSVIILPIYVGLIFTMFINGWTLLTGDNSIHLEYLNIYNRTPLSGYPDYYTIVFYTIAVLQLIVPFLLLFSLFKKELSKKGNANYFKWAILVAILSVTLYGYMVRVSSNHGGAATLFFYAVLLYFLLWLMEKRDININSNLFNSIKTLPIYFMLFYTMGFPGWQKLINSTEVMGKYSKMFNDSFLSKLPGGIEPFIYFVGILEILVPVLLVISFAKKEFQKQTSSIFLNFALLVSISTFVMLSFGLSVILNYPGATNLVFYGIFTLGLYYYSNNKTFEMS